MYSEILSQLGSRNPWRSQIHYFDTIDSTNTKAKEMALQGAPHGSVLIADRQTGGRGRMGRSFYSPGGMGIYMSVILRPQYPAAQLMHLTCAAAVAMCDAVEKTTGLRPGIKWTNDLVIGRKKVAGILTELGLNGENGNIDHAVIGIGINCRQAEQDFPDDIRSTATSLSLAAGKPVDRAALAANMITAFEEMSRNLIHKDAVLDRYRADCITLGQEVSILSNQQVRHGKALDIDSDGGLIVRFPDGHLEAIGAGEVSVRGMYGYI